MSKRSRAKAQKKARVPAALLKPPPPIAGFRGDSLSSLVLDGATVDLNVTDAVTDAQVSRTIEGGSTLTLELHDDADVLTHSGILDRDRDELLDRGVVCSIDGLAFVLARVECARPTYTLTFEDEPCVWLKTPRRPKKAYRDKMTRAQFAWSLIREVGLSAYIPELLDRQSTAKASSTSEKEKEPREKGADRRPGFSPGAGIKVKGVKADREQVKNIDLVLAEGYRRKASTRLLVALVMTVTQEAVARNIKYGDSAGPDSRGLFQQRAPWGPESVRRDPTKATGLFLDAWKRKHGSLRADSGSLEARIKAVQISVGGYAPWEREATATVRAWLGGAGGKVSSKEATSKEVAGRYAFTRGQQGKRESSWECLQRLATEVGWRCFTVGRTVVFASEEELLRQRPQMTLHEGGVGVERIGWTWDRAHTAQEASVTVRASRWGAQPGQCVELVDEGPATGRWLVRTVGRSLFSPVCEVVLTRPQREKPEPAAETRTVTTPGTGGSGARSGAAGGSDVRDRIIAIAKSSMTSKTGFSRYSQAGALTAQLNPKTARTDCSQWIRAVYLAAKAGDPGTNTWGMAAKGKRTTRPKPGDIMLTANTGHCEVWIGGGRTIGHGSPPIDYGNVASFPGHYFVTYGFLD